jgi:hypothetical protein
MFSLKSATLISALLFASTTAILQAGIKSSIAASFLEQGAESYFNYIMEQILIPNIDSPDGKNYMRDNHFVCQSKDGNVEFKTEVENNALVITVNNVKARFYSNDFYYKYARFLSVSGKLEVNFNRVKFVLGMGFSTIELPDGRIVPHVYGQDVKVQIDRQDVNIHLEGGMLTSVLNVITPYITGTVSGMVEQALF